MVKLDIGVTGAYGFLGQTAGLNVTVPLEDGFSCKAGVSMGLGLTGITGPTHEMSTTYKDGTGGSATVTTTFLPGVPIPIVSATRGFPGGVNISAHNPGLGMNYKYALDENTAIGCAIKGSSSGIDDPKVTVSQKLGTAECVIL